MNLNLQSKQSSYSVLKIVIFILLNQLKCFSVNANDFNAMQFSGPIIRVTANLNDIVDGSVLISPGINTDFGSGTSCNSISRSYTIQNTGDQDLVISNISLSSTNAGEFSVSAITFPANIIVGSSLNFSITFSPTATGVRVAVVHIENNDVLNNDFDFAIQGIGNVPVLGNYPSVSIIANENTSVTPLSVPVGINYLTASTSTNFTGQMTVDPVTGIVEITNAKPAGNYFVTVSDSGCVSKTFNLTVNPMQCNPGIFSITNNISIPFGPRSVAIADFNSDKKQDLVVAKGLASNVSVIMGNGSGIFASPVNITVGTSPYSVAIGDFNGDGKQDIVSANQASNDFSLLIGNGLGSFSPAVNFNVGANPYYIVVGDLNNDNKQDVVTANFTSNDLSVRLGNGNGSFNSMSNISTGIKPTAIAVADFNSDGNQDLAVTNYGSNNVSIFLGNGNGNFTLSGTVNVGSSPYSIEVGDFNGDNKQDFVTANNSNGTVSVRLGNGNGTFSGTTNITAGSGCSSVCLGDFNSDSNLDVATTNLTANTISILLGNGIGGFSLGSTLSTGAGTGPILLKSVRFTIDESINLVTCNLNSNNISLISSVKNEIFITGNNNPVFDGSVVPSVSNNTDFDTVAICNGLFKTFKIQNLGLAPLQINSISITGTNASDFLLSGITFPITVATNSYIFFNLQLNTTSIGLKSATVHINNSDCDETDFDFNVKAIAITAPSIGSYSNTNTKTGSNIKILPSSIPTGVSYLDVSASTGFTGSLTIDPGTGEISVIDAGPEGNYLITVSNGSCFSQTFILTVSNQGCNQINFNNAFNIGTFTSPRSIAVGDFNNDLFQDLAIASETGNNVTISLGNGSGGFSTFSTIGVGSAPFSLAISDLNKDGNEDLICANALSNNVSILLGDGSGSFNLLGNFATGTKPYFVVVCDFNGDKNPDLVTANNVSNNISILFGNGQGFFNSPVNFASGINPSSLCVSDFNNDGNPDFAVTNYGSTTVSIVLGNGIGGIISSSLITVGSKPYSISTGDFNDDGKTDLAVANNNSGSISIRMGDGLGGFTGTTNLSMGIGPSSVAIRDFNLDGNLDVIATSFNASAISFFSGNGIGGFSLFSTVNLLSNSGPIMIAPGEFNSDGASDFAVASLSSNRVYLLTGSGQEINLLANGNSISNQSTIISSAINTDFGSVSSCGSTVSKLFTIQNKGVVSLLVNNIFTDGVDASSFSVYSTFPITIQAGQNFSFLVQFNSYAVGVKNATVKILSNDCDESIFAFDIQGSGTAVIPTIGTYADASTYTGGNLSIVPNAAPVDIQFLNAIVPDNFHGIVNVDPVSGTVFITDAKPSGNYTITLSSECISKSFTLTVNNAGCNNLSYGSSTSIGSILRPRSIVVGDFNNDHIQDLAMVSETSNTVSISLGNGSGGFGNFSTIAVGSGPFSIAVGDFNKDGKQDLVTANSLSNNISILLGNGTGSFNFLGHFNTGLSPYSVIVEDFNGDKNQDIVTANFSSDNISILFGNEMGIFSVPTNVTVGTHPSSVAAGDFNNDGKKDLVVTNFDLITVSILLGNGVGGFSSNGTVTVGNNPYSIAISDFNNDGKSDIAVANNSISTVSIRLGDGLGGFSGSTNISTGSGPSSVVLRDFDMDGNMDMIISNLNGNTISFFKGNGMGGFTLHSTSNTGTGSGPISISAGEFDGDGIVDFVVANLNNDKISIINEDRSDINLQANGISIPNGSIDISSSINTHFGLISSCGPASIKTFTIQNTGISPLTISNISFSGSGSANFALTNIILPVTILGGGFTTFAIKFLPVTSGSFSATVHITSNDCDEIDYKFDIRGIGSGLNPSIASYNNINTITGGNLINLPLTTPSSPIILDVSTSNNFEGILNIDQYGKVMITDAHPAGNYLIKISSGLCLLQSFLLTVNNVECSPTSFSNQFLPTSIDNPRSIVTGDFNNDRKQDLAIVSETQDKVAISLGNGSGSFGNYTFKSVGSHPFSIAIGDFNKDGNQDLVTANALSNNVSILTGNGSGVFNLLGNFSTGAKPYFVVVGDFNGDKNPDVATANFDSNNISVLFGDGAGNFSSPIFYATGTNPTSLASSDFNNDGNIDFAVTNYANASISILQGNGSGGFNPNGTISVGNNPYSIAIKDFNGDGKADMAVANNSANSVSIRLGDGVGGFGGVTNINTDAGPSSIALRDFDIDGNTDLIVANYLASTITFFKGNGAGGFNFYKSISAGSNQGSIIITSGEFNGDGIVDFIYADLDNNRVSMLKEIHPEITLRGNNNIIADGSSIISSTNNTDFGSVFSCYLSSSRNFSINNSGEDSLLISSINFTGTDASDFSISGITLPINIPPASSLTFTITFLPTSIGIKSATVHIINNDCDESDFDFSIRGTYSINSPFLGNYNNISVNTGGNVINTPSSLPTNVTFLDLSISKNFLGIITIDPITGKINVTNAHPAGFYTVVVSMGSCLTRSFILTVNNPICSQGAFSSLFNAGTVAKPRSIAVGDFNKDGFQDLVIASEISDNVTVKLGNGTGTFTTLPPINIGDSPYSVTVGDFNQDGNQDIVTANVLSNNISVLIGNGTGSFSLLGNYVTGTKPYYVVVGDFNGDKYIDLATANFMSNNISVLPGNQFGGFSSPINTNVGSNPSSLSIGDFNNDGKMDIVTTNYNSNNVTVLLGNGMGGFTSNGNIAVGTGPYSIVMQDLNNDNKSDMIIANNLSNFITIRLGDGLGGFNTPTNITVGNGPASVVVRDINGDGKQDIISSNYSGHSLSILTGNGTGAFSLLSTLTSVGNPIMITAGDFNNDGRVDIAEADLDGNQVSLFYGIYQEINVVGNAVNIPDGSLTASIINNTNFGAALQCTSVNKNFTIQNTGASQLLVNSINIVGNDASSFSASGLTFPLNISAGSSATFTVTFSPLTVGVKNATIQILNNDCDEGNYDFAIQGTANSQNPVFTNCPGDQIVHAATGFCRSVINYTVSATLNPVFSYSFSGATVFSGSGTGSGLLFNEGITNVVITATGNCGFSTCNFEVTIVANTNDDDLCTIDICNTSSGTITNENVIIDDNNVCTIDGCNSLTGIYHTQVNADDSNACTTDGCNSLTGIFNKPIEVDDNNICTDDACNTITGVSHIIVSVDDNNACTKDGCNSITGVFHDPVEVDDNNLCTDDACNTITGVYHMVLSVDDNNVCTIDGCNSITGIFHNPVEVDDNNVCTEDICNSMTGMSHIIVSVDDNDACTTDGCNSITGVFHDPVNVDDENLCTDDGCNSVSGISHSTINVDDNNLCTIDGCNSITGIYHLAVDMDDNNLCTNDGCNSLTGEITHADINIDDNDPCTLDACDSTTGTTSHTDEIPILTIVTEPIKCYGESACLTVDASGGFPPYSGTGIFCGYIAGTYSITISDDHGCDVVEEVNLFEPDKMTAIISSTPTSCSSNDGTASVIINGGVQPYSYIWSPGGQTTSTISGLPPGNYIVNSTDVNGCSINTSVNVIASNTNPPVPGLISGNTNVCRGQSGLVYCVAPVDGALSYNWILPTGITITGATTGNCITVNINSRFSGGFLCVISVNACGVSASSCLNIIRINKKPNTPSGISGTTSVCPLTTANYFINSVTQASSYQWSSSGGIVIISGQGTTSIVVRIPAGFNNGELKVKAINCLGVSARRSKKINRNNNCKVASIELMPQSDDSEYLNSVTSFPNPSTGKLKLSFNSKIKTKLNLKLNDLLGNVIEMMTFNINVSENLIDLDLSNRPKGIYFIHLQIEGVYNKSIRIIIE
jgi:hypothetical protein